MNAVSRLGRSRDGFARGVVMLALIALCVWLAYLMARGDAADMMAAFIHRVRMMGQPD